MNEIKLIDIIDEDFVNYKKPSMFLVFPKCSMKCNKEAKDNVCQNENLLKEQAHRYFIKDIVDAYINNPITHAIVCGGLEPFDSFEELLSFINICRDKSNDDIVIYSGYNENEIENYINFLKDFENIIIKFGRFLPNSKPVFDEVLGVKLMSNNQYAKKIN